ncbi:YeeE/YedE thiosulfate transporter family protein [Methylorubrum suomiense]
MHQRPSLPAGRRLADGAVRAARHGARLRPRLPDLEPALPGQPVGSPGALAAAPSGLRRQSRPLLALLAALAWPLLRRLPAPEPRHAADPLHAVFVARWPVWFGGLAVGALGTLSYLRIGPLGVTAEIGGRSRQAAGAFGILPERLEGLDTFRGCATALRDAVLTPNGLFIGGLVLASFAAALVAGQFRPAVPSRGQVFRGLAGGVLLGWGAMTGLGCSVGTLLSGIMAGAVSGWVFGVAMFAGAAGTLWAGRRLGALA